MTLSGPLAQRSPLLATLAREGVDVEQEHGPRGFDTDVKEGWITARHGDINEVKAHAENAGWALRSHWPTPTCKACSGHSATNGVACGNCAGTGRTEKRPEVVPMDKVIADLQARIAQLEGKGV